MSGGREVKKTFYEPSGIDIHAKETRWKKPPPTDAEKKVDDGNNKPKELKLLQARETPVDLTADLKKTRLVNLGGSEETKPGFYCKECDCTVMDSLSYLDHINGARHQQNLGLSMRVERTTAEKVRQRIIELKRKKAVQVVHETFDEKVKRIEKMELHEKNERKRLKKEKKIEEIKLLQKEAAAYVDEECAQFMGFGNFGTKTKK